MKILLTLLCIPVFQAFAQNEYADLYIEPDPVDYVDPFIGTGGHGHTFPGPTAPFGMVQLSPDTRLEGWDGCSGYHYTDSIIYGFSHTHLSGTGVPDYGDILIMPVNNNRMDNYESPFLKKDEKAGAGYYSVHLIKPDVQVELTTTIRTGIHSYTYLKPEQPGFVIDLNHRDKLLNWKLELVNDTTIIGYRVSQAWAQEQYIYFCLHSSEPLTDETGSGPVRVFKLRSAAENLILKVGISAVDVDGARNNLETEAYGWKFADYAKELRSQWNKQLKKIIVEGGSPEDMIKFYTALYHCMIAPNIFSDVDGRYRGMDLKIHRTDPDHPQYTVFSLWDTFRTAHPLWTIIEPTRTKDFVQSLYRHYKDGGRLSMWELAGNYTGCMIGYHALSVFTDAAAKGLISPHQLQLYIPAMKEAMNQNRLGIDAFNTHGYIGAEEEPESVSKTLEYAYNNWCLAKALMIAYPDSVDHLYANRSLNYRNLFKDGFMQPRSNGDWMRGFDPAEVNSNFTEANSWQYSLFVPHDMRGLIDLHGGLQNFEVFLDSMFTTTSPLTGRDQADITGLIGQYAQGNEPDHHVPFLYYYVGKPYKSQKLINTILDSLYTTNPDGMPGNEDCGQMSAWYVMSAIGLYPVLPGADEYYICNPVFTSVLVRDDFNQKLKIVSNQDGPYLERVLKNKTEIEFPILHHEELGSGMTLNITSSNEETDWRRLYDIANWLGNEVYVETPRIVHNGRSFYKQTLVQIEHPNPSAELYYTTDGSHPDRTSPRYITPIPLKETSTVKAIAFVPIMDTEDSPMRHGAAESAVFYKNNSKTSVRLDTKYSNQYTGGGDNALIDGIKGGKDFRTGAWQGYLGKDFSAVLDLGKKQKIHSVSINALEDTRAWIWFPGKITIEYSKDGVTYRKAGEIVNDSKSVYGDIVIKSFELKDISAKGRFIRITATNHGPNPEDHPGAGDKTWLFFDEIEVK